VNASGFNSIDLPARLRAIGAERYHDKHPFHALLHAGKLTRRQVQAWALNRYYYQSRIPIKDAIIVAKLPTPQMRQAWRSRLVDHDGTENDPGGIARWLVLAEGVGLRREDVLAERGVLPGVRFAVDAYVNFVRERSVLEAVASSLTELFAPAIIADRVQGMLANYDYIDRAKLAYFESRPRLAGNDSALALDWVQQMARSKADEEAVLAALRFKCDLLWAQLDALFHAYVEPGHIPPGAFRPQP
jgi:pyrroloquinoline-quinone synthase